MMLPALENTPRSEKDWLEWAWHHRDSHDRIRAAIQTATGEILTDYQVEPIAPYNVKWFLENNSLLHGEMNAATRQQSADLLDVDLKDPRQLESWIRIHYLEHYQAETALGLAI